MWGPKISVSWKGKTKAMSSVVRLVLSIGLHDWRACEPHVRDMWKLHVALFCQRDSAHMINISESKEGGSERKRKNRSNILQLFCCCLVPKSCPTLQPHGLQHARLPCPSLSPGVCAHSTISPSVSPFSSCSQYFPSSGSFPMSWFFLSGGQSIGVSASAPVLPMSNSLEVSRVSCSVMSDSFVTPWTVPHRLLYPWDFPGKTTGVGSHSLLQGIFLTGIELRSPALKAIFLPSKLWNLF